MNFLDIDFLKNNCKKIHAFGLGFIQLKISDTERVHFYVPEVQTTVNEEDIHNHRYGFESTILKGSLKQDIFSITMGPGQFLLRDESCSTDRPKSFRDPETCNVRLIISTELKAGSSYIINRDTYHRVSSDRCITLVKREPRNAILGKFAFDAYKEYAQVISKIDDPKTCPFSANLPEKELWEIVEREINDAY